MRTLVHVLGFVGLIGVTAMQLSACGARSPTAHDGSAGNTSCACDPKLARQRCAGAVPQVCVDGQWTARPACATDEVCAAGACLPARGATGCPDEARYDGNQALRERYAPIRVTDCIPGGELGREVHYAENQSETRKRALRFIGLTGCDAPASELAWPGGFSSAFGVNIDESVSSSRSLSLGEPSGAIPPGQFAAFYRQTERIERVATLWRQGAFAGLAVLTDWVFRPELAIGPTCLPACKLLAVQLPACWHQSDGCLPCR